MAGDRVTYQAGGWHFTCTHRPLPISIRPEWPFLALAKRERFVNFHPIYEPGDVWFEYGSTAADALSKLEAQVMPGAKLGIA